MPELSNRELLQVWERGAPLGGTHLGSAGLGTTRLALLWLAAGWPHSTWDELAAVPLGVRDRRLLGLYRDTFGDSLECQADCSECGEELEADLSVAELLSGLSPASKRAPASKTAQASKTTSTSERAQEGDDGHGQSEQGRYEHAHQELRLVFRMPNSGDLLAAEVCGDATEARRLLSERCVLEAYRRDEPVPLGQLREEDIEQLATSMAHVDPAVEIRIAFRCPACGHAWKQLLDIVAFLDDRGRQRARRLLEDVHLLARGYGWSEEGILAMSDQRRRTYLEMLGHA